MAIGAISIAIIAEGCKGVDFYDISPSEAGCHKTQVTPSYIEIDGEDIRTNHRWFSPPALVEWQIFRFYLQRTTDCFDNAE